MSIEGIHWAQRAKADPYRKALLYALGERHNIDSGICFPDQVMLARDAGMTDRTVRKYVKLLEEEGFITRHSMTAGGRSRLYYVLHFERTEPLPIDARRKDIPVGDEAPTGTPVPAATGTPVPVATGTCVPVHIEEHESNTNMNTNTSSDSKPSRGTRPRTTEKAAPAASDSGLLEAFDQLWRCWPAKGRERSRSRSMVLDQFRRSAKLQPVETLLAAARTFVAKTEDRYVPALERWLQQGRYEHFMPKDLVERAMSPGGAGAAGPTTAEAIDWDAAVAKYVRSGIWPNRLGGRPDEFDYRGALAPLEAIMANGKFGDLNVNQIRQTIIRLRAERGA